MLFKKLLPQTTVVQKRNSIEIFIIMHILLTNRENSTFFFSLFVTRNVPVRMIFPIIASLLTYYLPYSLVQGLKGDKASGHLDGSVG